MEEWPNSANRLSGESQFGNLKAEGSTGKGIPGREIRIRPRNSATSKPRELLEEVYQRRRIEKIWSVALTRESFISSGSVIRREDGQEEENREDSETV